MKRTTKIRENLFVKVLEQVSGNVCVLLFLAKCPCQPFRQHSVTLFWQTPDNSYVKGGQQSRKKWVDKAL